jgi:AcrR family transcriptional regulator
MVVGSIVRPRILETAIRLFGLYGRNGVNMRALVKAAHTTPGTVYIMFKSKEKLYEAAVTASINRALEAVAKSVFVFVDKNDDDDILSMVGNALKLWYSGLGQAEARVLMQVEMADPRWRQRARVPLEKMAHHLATALQKARHGSKTDAHQDAQNALATLFKYKVDEQPQGYDIGLVIDRIVLSMSKK